MYRLTVKTIIFLSILLFFGTTVLQAKSEFVVVLTSGQLDLDDDIFVSDISSRLAEYDIELISNGSDFYLPPETVTWMQVATAEQGIRLFIFSRSSHIKSISPILEGAIFSEVTIPGEDADTLLMGYALYSAGYFDDAELYLLTLVDNSDTRLQDSVLFLLGNIELLRENYESAIDYYEAVDLSISLTNLAWTYSHTGQSETAFAMIDDHERSLRENSNPVNLINPLRTRAQLHALNFDYDSAIVDIDEAIEIANSDDFARIFLPELYTVRGEIIFLIYEWDRVEQNFNTAIELAPDYAPAYFQRGVLFYTMARREDALSDFETYLELEPDGIHSELAKGYIDSIQAELDALGG